MIGNYMLLAMLGPAAVVAAADAAADDSVAAADDAWPGTLILVTSVTRYLCLILRGLLTNLGSWVVLPVCLLVGVPE